MYVQDIVGINFTVSSHLVVAAPVRRPAKIQRHTCVHEHGFCTHALLADKEMDGRRCSWKPWEVPRPVFTRERSPVTDRLIPGRWDHRVLLRAVEAPGAQASSTTSSTSSHSFNLAGSPNTGNVQDCQVCVRGHILPDSSDELCSGPSALFCAPPEVLEVSAEWNLLPYISTACNFQRTRKRRDHATVVCTSVIATLLTIKDTVIQCKWCTPYRQGLLLLSFFFFFFPCVCPSSLTLVLCHGLFLSWELLALKYLVKLKPRWRHAAFNYCTQQINSYIKSLPRVFTLTGGLMLLPVCSCAAFILMFSQFAEILKALRGGVGSLFLPLLMVNLSWWDYGKGAGIWLNLLSVFFLSDSIMLSSKCSILMWSRNIRFANHMQQLCLNKGL